MIKDVLVIVLIALVVKISYIFFGTVYLDGFDELHRMGQKKYVLELFERNDAHWYKRIAETGHEHITPDKLGYCNGDGQEQSYYNFFPLYPATIGIAMRIFKMDFLSMASILNFLYSILCFLLFYFFTSKEIKSNRNALLSTILLILFPFHYYFSMYYSEALYLSLVLLCFLMIQLNKNLLLSIFLVLLVLVRPNGMFMTIPLFIYFIEKRYGINSSIFLNRKWQDFLPILSFVQHH